MIPVATPLAPPNIWSSSSSPPFSSSPGFRYSFFPSSSSSISTLPCSHLAPLPVCLPPLISSASSSSSLQCNYADAVNCAASFPDTAPYCKVSSGGCVECLKDTQCPAPTPYCDLNNACVEVGLVPFPFPPRPLSSASPFCHRLPPFFFASSFLPITFLFPVIHSSSLPHPPPPAPALLHLLSFSSSASLTATARERIRIVSQESVSNARRTRNVAITRTAPPLATSPPIPYVFLVLVSSPPFLATSQYL